MKGHRQPGSHLGARHWRLFAGLAALLLIVFFTLFRPIHPGALAAAPARASLVMECAGFDNGYIQEVSRSTAPELHRYATAASCKPGLVGVACSLPAPVSAVCRLFRLRCLGHLSTQVTIAHPLRSQLATAEAITYSEPHTALAQLAAVPCGLQVAPSAASPVHHTPPVPTAP